MKDSKLFEIAAGLDNRAEYGDQESCNATFEASNFCPNIFAKDGHLWLKETQHRPPVNIGTSIDCSLLLGHPLKGTSRVLFEGDFADSPKRPTCQSDDGITPSSAEPVSSSCKTCPKSQFGSGKNGKGTACRAIKTLYLVLIQDEPMLVTLKVSGKTLANSQAYVGEFTELGLAVSKLITSLSIDPESQYPVIEFDVKQALKNDNFEAIQTYTEIALDHIK